MVKLFWWMADLVISIGLIGLGLAVGFLCLTTFIFLVAMIRLLAGVTP